MPALSSSVVLALLLMTLLLPLMKGESRRHYQTLLICVCTIATVLFFGQILKGDGKPAKLQSVVSEEKAESALRMMSCINVGISKVYEVGGPLRDSKGKQHTAIEMSKTGLDTYFKTAETSLQDAIKSNPDNTTLKAKLVVLLSVYGKHRDKMTAACREIKASKNPKEAELGALLEKICLEARQPGLNKTELENEKGLIESAIPKGWYQESAILALYKTSDNRRLYQAYSNQLEERFFTSFKTGLTFLAFGCIFAFVGVVVIVIQLGTLGRREQPNLVDEEKIKLDISLRTVFAVFVGWMSCQLAISEVFKLLADERVGHFIPKLALSGNPLGIACFSFVTYLVTMVPALVLIYLIAIRPNGLSPIDALKLRFSTSRAGPFKLLLNGFLSWCAIIPCVVFCSAISSALGSQGSDNPILPQIAMIAGSKNMLAIGLLLITVAALAPFCEEIIFRGFLYSALRIRIGIFPAILVSSFVFAGIHCDKGGMLMLLSLGPVLALAYERNRSLLPSMIAHGLWNGGSFTMMLALFYS